MKISTSNIHDQHQPIQLLLPWYINQSLQQDERERVASHLRHCLVCRRELIRLRKLAEAIAQSSELEMAAERSFANLTSKLSRQRSAQTLLPPNIKAPQRKSVMRFLAHDAVRYAMAASLMLALIPLGARLMSGFSDDSFYTLSTANSALNPAGELRVMFAKSTSAADIAATLNQLHGQQVGEANSVGALTIRLVTDSGGPSLHQAIALLRRRPDVLLAEPVLQP